MRKLLIITISLVLFSPAYWADPTGGVCSVWAAIGGQRICVCYQYGC